MKVVYEKFEMTNDFKALISMLAKEELYALLSGEYMLIDDNELLDIAMNEGFYFKMVLGSSIRDELEDLRAVNHACGASESLWLDSVHVGFDDIKQIAAVLEKHGK